MKKNYLIIFIFLFFIPFANLRSQSISQEVAMGMDYRGVIQISVFPDRGRHALEGASVLLIDAKDTLGAVTDASGGVYFINKYSKRDSISAVISFLGFKEKKITFPPSRSYHLVNLEEEPLEMNALIFTEKTVAVVVKGDTTIFDAAAFPSMKGTSLNDLLAKLPGVSVKNGAVYAGGQPVRKILINGNMMFGNNVKAALDLVESENVKEVKVFDEYARDRMLEADTLGAKERVMDVVTKEPLKSINSLSLYASAGAEAASETSPNPEFAGTVGVGVDKFGIDSPMMSASLSFGKNDEDARASEIRGSYTTGIGKHRRYNLMSDLSFDFGKKRSASSTFSEYRDLSGNKTEERSSSVSSDFSIGYSLGFTKSFGEKASINSLIQLDYSRRNSDDVNENSSIIGGENLFTNILRSKKIDVLNPRIEVGYYNMLNEKGRVFSLSGSSSFNLEQGRGGIVDVHPLSSFKQNLADTSKSRVYDFSLGAQYSEPLVGKLSLVGEYKINAEYRRFKSVYWDNIKSKFDEVKGRSQNDFKVENKAGAGLKISLKYFSFNLLGFVKSISQSQNDLRLAEVEASKRFWRFSPDLIISYRNPKCDFNLRYSESEALPAPFQLSGRIDDLNPVFLNAGNPDLKISVVRHVITSFNLNFPVSALTLSLSSGYQNISNIIARSVTVFSADTPLPKYNNYMAKAGSQLSIPINISGASNFNASFGLNKILTRLKTKIDASVSFNGRKSPFYLNEQEKYNKALIWEGRLGLDGFAWKQFNWSIYSSIAHTDEYVEENKFSNSIRYGFRAAGRIFLWERLKINPVFHYIKSDFDRDDLDYSRYMLNADISYVFGKRSQAEIGVFGTNLLNDVNNKKSYLTEQLFRTEIRNDYLGRIVGVRFSYKFK